MLSASLPNVIHWDWRRGQNPPFDPAICGWELRSLICNVISIDIFVLLCIPFVPTRSSSRQSSLRKFLQQLRPAVGAHVRRGQLDCCDGLHGEGYVVSTAGVQAALLADVGAAGRLRVAPCAAPCKRPILGRSSSQVQVASRRLLFNCHRWRYDTQFCETAKQDGFGRGFGPETGPWKASRPKRSFFETPSRRRWRHEINMALVSHPCMRP